MKTVSLEQQLSLMLADIYDFKVTEIAEILQATTGVVKHYLKSRTVYARYSRVTHNISTTKTLGISGHCKQAVKSHRQQ